MNLRKRKPSSSVITSEPRKTSTNEEKSGKHSRIGSTSSNRETTTTETTTTTTKTTSHAKLPSDYATTFISSSQLSNKEPQSEKIFKIRRKRCAQTGQQLTTRKNGGNSSLLFTKLCFKLPKKRADANATSAKTSTNNDNDQNKMNEADEDENNNDKNSKNKNINPVSSKTTVNMAMDASDGASNDHISDRTNDEDCLILDESSRGF